MKQLILGVMIIILFGCDAVKTKSIKTIINKGEITHNLYYSGITQDQAKGFSDFLKSSGLYSSFNYDMKVFINRDSSNNYELYIPLTADNEASLLTKSLISILIFDIESNYNSKFSVFSYYSKSDHKDTAKKIDYSNDPKFAWMKEEKKRLTVKGIAEKVREQFVFLRELMMEAHYKDYSYMAFGAVPASIYFATNGIGVIPRKRLERRSISIYNNPFDAERAIEIISVAFKNVKWPSERKTIFKSHADALTQMIRNLDVILDSWESLPKELQEPPELIESEV